MKPRKPGKNIPNSQRHTTLVTLRMQPGAATRLRELAAEHGTSLVNVVSVALEIAGERVGAELKRRG